MNFAPYLMQRFEDNNGEPLIGGLLYSYAAGTSTPIATYTDSTGFTQNTNPIILNSRGEANVWLIPGIFYQFILKDQYGSLIWSVDNISVFGLGGLTPPAGPLGSVQYNVLGTFAGDAAFTFDGSTLFAPSAVIGAATGGYQGPGTVNATAVYVNGVAIGAGAAGADRQIQFNNLGAFGADSGLVYANGGIGLGGTLWPWGNLTNAIQNLYGAFFCEFADAIGLAQNTYYDGAAWRFATTGPGAAEYRLANGTHQWFVASGGVAGAVAPLHNALSITLNGNVVVSMPVTNAGAALDVIGFPTGIALNVDFGSTVLGSPTGGSMGTGTLNASGLYVNGVAVSTGAATVPGGLTTQMQYNNAGAFAGSPLTYDPSVQRFYMAGAPAGSTFQINGGIASIPLDIVGSSPTYSYIQIRTLLTTGGEIGDATSVMFHNAGVAGDFAISAGASLSLGTGNWEAIRVNVARNVTINAPASGVALSVSGTAEFTNVNVTGSTIPAVGIYRPTTNTLGFATNSTQVGVLDASGNLGLGVTPSAWATGQKVFETTGGSISSGANNEVYFGQNFYYGGAGPVDRYIRALAAGNYNITSGVHTWKIAGVGTAGNPITWTQAMTLDASGRLMVAQTTASAAGAGVKFQANSDILATGSLAGIFWENRSGGVSAGANWYGWYTTLGTIYLFNAAANVASINPSTGVYTALSDANKKKDIAASNVGLTEILSLQPRYYRMKDQADDAPLSLGFIAQEVKDIIPAAYVENTVVDAGGNEAAFIGLQDRPIIAALVKAVQELTARLAVLEAK